MGGLIGVKEMTLNDFTGPMVLRGFDEHLQSRDGDGQGRGLSFAGPRPPCSALVLRAQKLTLVRTQTSMLPALSIE